MDGLPFHVELNWSGVGRAGADGDSARVSEYAGAAGTAHDRFIVRTVAGRVDSQVARSTVVPRRRPLLTPRSTIGRP